MINISPVNNIICVSEIIGFGKKMKKFIYAFDENTKNSLLSLNYHFFQESIMNGNKVYIFENKINSNFDINKFDRTKLLFTDTLLF